MTTMRLLLQKMLTFYKKGYKYKWDIQQNVRGRKIQYVELKTTES